MKEKVIVTICSFGVLPIWGLSFLAVTYANQLTLFYGLVLTAVLFRWLGSKVRELGNGAYLLGISGPVFYLIAMLFVQPEMEWEAVLPNPILMGFMVASLSLLITVRKLVLYPFIVVSVIAYATFIFPIYQTNIELGNIDFKEVIQKKDSLDLVPLSEFPAIEQEIGDKLKGGNYDQVLIETWNEKCKPCMESMADLQPFMDTNPRVLHVFLYQKMGNTNLSDREVMNFKKIGNPNKILIDVNNAYYDRLKLSGYPYFILYDANGNALDWFSGYLSHFQEDYENHLTQLFSTN
jgi:thiol-disulfide isomerase/thioredoxin